jgi:ribosomal subunit interface protein
MQVTITARNLELTAGARQRAEQRLEKMTRYAADIHGAHVIVAAERVGQLVVKQEHADAGGAIELAMDRLEEQLRRLKDRRLDQTQRAGGRPEPTEPEPTPGQE